jgi:hypothetical protein
LFSHFKGAVQRRTVDANVNAHAGSDHLIDRSIQVQQELIPGKRVVHVGAVAPATREATHLGWAVFDLR